MALEQLDLLEEDGVDPQRVAIGHCDRNADWWLRLQIAHRGAFVAYDGRARSLHPSSRTGRLRKLLTALTSDLHVAGGANHRTTNNTPSG